MTTKVDKGEASRNRTELYWLLPAELELLQEIRTFKMNGGVQ